MYCMSRYQTIPSIVTINNSDSLTEIYHGQVFTVIYYELKLNNHSLRDLVRHKDYLRDLKRLNVVCLGWKMVYIPASSCNYHISTIMRDPHYVYIWLLIMAYVA
jgi:hypothetical protein